MKLHKSCLLPVICTIILVVTTYATSTEAAKQKQAEVNLQQVDVAAPSRSLKYGDKTTKKIPNQEVLLVPTSPTVTERKRNTSNLRPRSRVERIELPTTRPAVQISRRYDSETQQNLLVVQHDVPLVEKTLELFNKPIAPTTKTTTITPVGQQRSSNLNRSRSSNALTLQQPQQPTQQYSNLNYKNEQNVAKIKSPPATTTTSSSLSARHNSRQRKPTTTHNINSSSSAISSTNNINRSSSIISHNANVHTHYPTNNSTIVSHQHHNSNYHHSNNENIVLNNNNINSKKSQPLLASSNAVVSSDGLQNKTSSNKQRGNVTKHQSVGSTTIRNTNIRKFTSTAPTISAIPSRTFTSSTTTTTSKLFLVIFNVT